MIARDGLAAVADGLAAAGVSVSPWDVDGGVQFSFSVWSGGVAGVGEALMWGRVEWWDSERLFVVHVWDFCGRSVSRRFRSVRGAVSCVVCRWVS